MPISLARATLHQYQICESTVYLQSKYPHQIERRTVYINYLDNKLSRLLKQPDYAEILSLAAGIHRCVEQMIIRACQQNTNRTVSAFARR